MTHRIVPSGILAVLLGARAVAVAGEPPLEEVLVTASLREAPAGQIAESVTVLDAPTLRLAGVQHFEDVFGLVPNLNWSAGTSRPRYLQLRGIGELEQYQGAPNSSVGFLIDDIDFSGIGMPATLFDVGHIEVLRGPQGTAYGANALAGLVSVRTREPSRQPDQRVEASAGDHGTWALGGEMGGPMGEEEGAWRLVAQQYRSDGFRRNATLGHDATNGYDEATLRAKLHQRLAPELTADLTLMYVDLNNGFDAFSIDNSRTTLSDKPGRDAQRSRGAALRLVYSGFEGFDLRSLTTFADSAILYSFDGDWGADPAYDYFSRSLRTRRTVSQELRATSRSGEAGGEALQWIAGLYLLDASEGNDQLDLYDGGVLDALTSHYHARNLAAYAQTDRRLGERSSISFGLRLERRDAHYGDSDGSAFAPAETMNGGHLSYELALSDERRAYLTLSRGYKAGGFNIGALVPPERRQFRAEYLWNLEAGLKWRSAQARLEGEVTVFYMRREAQQVQTSFQVDPNDPLSYIFITDNAARGVNQGLEGSILWHAGERWQFGGTLGLLETRFIGYQFGDRNLDGRAQAHAPDYQYSVLAQYRDPRGYLARLDLQGVASFYFDTSHDQRSRPYRLVNLKLGYDGARWSAFAWARNLFNASYAQRGFYFSNDPVDPTPHLFVQAGDPRQLGFTVQHSFH